MAWTMVLAASLLMPATIRLAASTFPAVTIVAPHMAPLVAEAPPPSPTVTDTTVDTQTIAEPARTPIDWRKPALLAYIAISALLIARLTAGLALSWRITRSASPIHQGWTNGFDVRISPRIAAPATFGSVILLPPGHVAWAPAKRAAVLAHEGAHVLRRDSVVQIAAGAHKAIFWFNPLSWWLQRHLSLLAEAASDDAAIARLDNRIGYAEILLDVSRSGQRLPGAMAMARAATVAARIERILSETTATIGISRRGRLLMLATILPLAAAVAEPLSATAPSATNGDTALANGRTPHQRITIDPKLLDADEGIYEDMSSGSVMVVTRDGDHLLTGRMGMPRVAEYPYSDHDFFLTVAAEQNSFIADRSGHVDRVVHYRNGLATTLDRITPAEASALQADYERRHAEELKPHVPVAVDPAVLDRYVGYYRLTPAFLLSVTRDGDQLYAQGTGRNKVPVFAYNDHEFFYTVVAAQLTFVPASHGAVPALILHQDGRDRRADRVSADVAERLQLRLDEERQPHTPTTVAEQRLGDYAGRYASSTTTMIIRRENDHLLAQVAGFNEYSIYAYTDHDFFATTLPAQVSFVRDPAGKTTGLIRHEHGEDQTLIRID
jgi:beta-lactamase regulating signal transducer with metallopeptidase domain